MSTASYTAAIIGTGRIGSLLEKDPLRPHPCTHAGWYEHPSHRTKLVAGCDTQPEARAAFGEQWDLPSDQLYEDYHDLLQAEKPDIVSICAYAPQRRDMTQAALEAGAKGLWIEKYPKEMFQRNLSSISLVIVGYSHKKIIIMWELEI